MQTINIQDAKSNLEDVIGKLQTTGAIIILKDQKPVARLSAVLNDKNPPPRLGTLKGTVLYMAPDFNAPLEEFKEYME